MQLAIINWKQKLFQLTETRKRRMIQVHRVTAEWEEEESRIYHGLNKGLACERCMHLDEIRLWFIEVPRRALWSLHNINISGD